MLDKNALNSGEKISYGLVTVCTPTQPMYEYKVLKNLSNEVIVSKELRQVDDENTVCIIKIENNMLEIYSSSSINNSKSSISCEI